ncbi:DUF427 domain-containing protein [Hoeflea sp.]|uniref:DUF427 domain-containing protein n=1 Tax=Hoeflea sp. TaxID=1940281 RepID=UPI003B5283EA
MSVMKPENVADYPRPPAIEPFSGSVQVRFNGELIADTNEAFRILETYHPPTFYLPLASFKPGVLVASKGPATMCEWKGQASYFDIISGDAIARRAAWTYRKPDPRYSALTGHVALYAEPMDEVLVNGERVLPQPGNFYGGWVTHNISGPIKGQPGTTHW